VLAPLSHVGHLDPWLAGALGAVWVFMHAADRLKAAGTRVAGWVYEAGEPTFEDPRVEAVWARHWNGELTLSETEAELETLLDAPQRELRETVEAIDGIGPRTSAALAAEFESLGALRAASWEELCAVEGVGPHTAALLAASAEGSSE